MLLICRLTVELARFAQEDWMKLQRPALDNAAILIGSSPRATRAAVLAILLGIKTHAAEVGAKCLGIRRIAKAVKPPSLLFSFRPDRSHLSRHPLHAALSKPRHDFFEVGLAAKVVRQSDLVRPFSIDPGI